MTHSTQLLINCKNQIYVFIVMLSVNHAHMHTHTSAYTQYCRYVVKNCIAFYTCQEVKTLLHQHFLCGLLI